jgi:hypothetical protein
MRNTRQLIVLALLVGGAGNDRTEVPVAGFVAATSRWLASRKMYQLTDFISCNFGCPTCGGK